MKFGHNLPRNQVPEWASSYINYKGLNKLIKNAAEASKNGAELDLAGEFQRSRLYRNALEHVSYIHGVFVQLKSSRKPRVYSWRHGMAVTKHTTNNVT